MAALAHPLQARKSMVYAKHLREAGNRFMKEVYKTILNVMAVRLPYTIERHYIVFGQCKLTM